MLPKVKFHQNALYSEARRDPFAFWSDSHYELVARHDNDNPSKPLPVLISCNPDWLPGSTPEERLAVAILDAYTHEFGEQVQIEGLNLNQHTAEGATNLERIIELLAKHSKARWEFNGGAK